MYENPNQHAEQASGSPRRRGIAVRAGSAAALVIGAVLFLAAPASAADAAAPVLATTGQSLPWIAGIVAAVLVIGGGLAFWTSARKRRAAQEEADAGDGGVDTDA